MHNSSVLGATELTYILTAIVFKVVFDYVIHMHAVNSACKILWIHTKLCYCEIKKYILYFVLLETLGMCMYFVLVH